MVTSCILTLFGAISFAVWLGDVVTGDSVCAALGLCEARPVLALSGGAAVVPAVAIRRDARLREVNFQAALAAAFGLAFVALIALVGGVASRFTPALPVAAVMFALATALVWSLSRPSAKEWFTSGPVHRSKPT